MKTLKFQSSVTSKQNGVERYFESNPWYITVFEKTKIQYTYTGPMLKQKCCCKKCNKVCNNLDYIALFVLCNFHF